VVLDVVAGIERKRVRRAGRHMRGEAVRAARFALHEVPERDATRRTSNGGDAVGVRHGREQGTRQDQGGDKPLHGSDYFKVMLFQRATLIGRDRTPPSKFW
jgi:hypothetical protein